MRIAVLSLLALLVAACGSNAPKAAVTKPPQPTARAVDSSPLACRARATSQRPRDHTTVGIQVRTVAHAWVTVAGTPSFLTDQSANGHASAHGTRTLRFSVAGATPGGRLVVDIRVSRPGRKGTCQASIRPRSDPRPAAQPTAPAQPAAPPSPAPAPPPTTAASCYPISDEGTCYEPGEFCRDDDHGTSGVAGDGEKITCEDNDGWRWEPV
jgi:hypothetical protein